MAREIHVGDIGTLYRIRIQDNAVDFDPSSAAVKELVFRLPGNVLLRKTATVAVGTGDEEGQWFLTYRVLAADGAGTPPGEFHAAVGKVRMQGFLEWADGSRFSTDERTTDDEGFQLKIHKNIENPA
jgi:hypothetical protein